jgi:membrane dipeptidase
MVQIADLHCDTIIKVQAGADPASDDPQVEVRLPALERGQVGLQVFACFVSSVLPEARAVAEAQVLLGLVDDLCRRYPDRLQRVETAAEVAAAWAAGRIAVVSAVENGHAIGGDLANLERLREAGARSMTLTHTSHLSWAASSAKPLEGVSGLTAFGENVVGAMNELGMIIDVSHVHETTFRDVARLSRKPFIASHSCASALCPIPRNISDDQIRAVADSGGMVGINFFPGFLDLPYWERLLESCGDLFSNHDRLELEKMDDPAGRIEGFRRFGEELKRRLAGVDVGLERVADHVEHVVSLVGDEHAGFGSDFDGVPTLPRGISGSECFPDILDALRRRGLGEQSIERIASGNFLRILG